MVSGESIGVAVVSIIAISGVFSNCFPIYKGVDVDREWEWMCDVGEVPALWATSAAFGEVEEEAKVRISTSRTREEDHSWITNRKD